MSFTNEEKRINAYQILFSSAGTMAKGGIGANHSPWASSCALSSVLDIPPAPKLHYLIDRLPPKVNCGAFVEDIMLIDAPYASLENQILLSITVHIGLMMTKYLFPHNNKGLAKLLMTILWVSTTFVLQFKNMGSFL